MSFRHKLGNDRGRYSRSRTGIERTVKRVAVQKRKILLHPKKKKSEENRHISFPLFDYNYSYVYRHLEYSEVKFDYDYFEYI